jgi:hypothetical protein
MTNIQRHVCGVKRSNQGNQMRTLTVVSHMPVEWNQLITQSSENPTKKISPNPLQPGTTVTVTVSPLGHRAQVLQLLDRVA